MTVKIQLNNGFKQKRVVPTKKEGIHYESKHESKQIFGVIIRPALQANWEETSTFPAAKKWSKHSNRTHRRRVSIRLAGRLLPVGPGVCEPATSGARLIVQHRDSGVRPHLQHNIRSSASCPETVSGSTNSQERDRKCDPKCSLEVKIECLPSETYLYTYFYRETAVLWPHKIEIVLLKTAGPIMCFVRTMSSPRRSKEKIFHRSHTCSSTINHKTAVLWSYKIGFVLFKPDGPIMFTLRNMSSPRRSK